MSACVGARDSDPGSGQWGERKINLRPHKESHFLSKDRRKISLLEAKISKGT